MSHFDTGNLASGDSKLHRGAKMPAGCSDLDPTSSNPADVAKLLLGTSTMPLRRQSILPLSIIIPKHSIDGTQQTPNEVEIKVKAIAERGLLHNDTIVEIDFNKNLLKDPELMKLLEKYDTNGDGELNIKEISRVFNDIVIKKKKFNTMKFVIIFTVMLIVILLGSNTLLTLWMLKLTNVMNTNSSNNYLTNTRGDVVITDKPVYYVTIADLPLLPSAALDALTRLSFSTEDGSLHNYVVKVIVDFTSSKQLIVTGNRAVFTNVLEGGAVENLVVVNNQPLVAQRRLQLMQGLGSGSSDIAHRCSLVSGVCYHTFEEMMRLHGVDGEAGQYAGGRQLQNSQSGADYCEVVSVPIGKADPQPTTGAPVYLHPGAVMLGTVNVYIVWYGDWTGAKGSGSNSAVQTIVKDFVSNLGGSSYWNTITTYYDISGTRLSPNLVFQKDITVPNTLGNVISAPNNGSQIPSVARIINKAIFSGLLPTDASGVYLVIPSENIIDAGNPSCAIYCGYHSYWTSNPYSPDLSNSIIYGLITNPKRCPPGSGQCISPNLRTSAGSPNGNEAADAMVNMIAHELAEAITNPLGSAWYNGDPTNSNGLVGEVMDQCGWNFSAMDGFNNNSNIDLGGKKYLIQQFWANDAFTSSGACVMSSPAYTGVSPPLKFGFTGSYQTYTVPTGVSSIVVAVAGAGGGTNIGNTYGNVLFYGSQIVASLTVTPGQILYLFVGGAGISGKNNAAATGGRKGGWNGGGNGYASYKNIYASQGGGYAGGGATDIRTTSGYTDYGNRLIVAGGGGGFGVLGYNKPPTYGNPGDPNYSGQPGTSGSIGVGGNGAKYTDSWTGGGGGGYVGGNGGGTGHGGIGALGSSYCGPSGVQLNFVAKSNYRDGWVQISFTCPAGFYCPDVLTNIQQCPAGNYCPAGSTSPILCIQGYYCPGPSSSTGPGSSAGVLCAAGNYCARGVSAMTQCPQGSYCPAGSWRSLPCPATVTCPAGGSVCANCPTYAPTMWVNTNPGVPSKKPVAACKPSPTKECR